MTQNSKPFSLSEISLEDPEDTSFIVEYVNDEESADSDCAEQYQRRLSRAAEKQYAFLVELGVSPEVARERAPVMAGAKLAHRGNQRHLETGARVCDAARIAFFEGRTDRELLADALKGIRQDGGSAGPTNRYKQLIEQADGDAARAAELMAEKVGERIESIRWAVASTLNEIARREAVAAGKDPFKAAYFGMSAK